MTDSDSEPEGLSLEKSKSAAKAFGIAAVVLLGIFLLAPSQGFKNLAYLGLGVTGWMFLFQGSTAISMSLEGVTRYGFQVGISIIVPIALSLLPFPAGDPLSSIGIPDLPLSPSFLLLLAVTSVISWHLVGLLDSDHPFRGFLIASAAFYLLVQGGDSRHAAALFLIYVSVSYASMLARIFRDRKAS